MCRTVYLVGFESLTSVSADKTDMITTRNLARIHGRGSLVKHLMMLVCFINLFVSVLKERGGGMHVCVYILVYFFNVRFKEQSVVFIVFVFFGFCCFWVFFF